MRCSRVYDHHLSAAVYSDYPRIHYGFYGLFLNGHLYGPPYGLLLSVRLSVSHPCAEEKGVESSNLVEIFTITYYSTVFDKGERSRSQPRRVR